MSSTEPLELGGVLLQLDQAVVDVLAVGNKDDLDRAGKQLEVALEQRAHVLAVPLEEIYRSASWYQAAASLGAVQVALLLVTSRRMQFEPPAPQAF